MCVYEGVRQGGDWAVCTANDLDVSLSHFAYQVQLLNCGGLRLLAYVGKAFRKKHAAGLKQWLDSSL